MSQLDSRPIRSRDRKDGAAHLARENRVGPASSVSTISECLRAARLSASPLDGFPESPPATLEMAYRIQSHSIANWPDKVAGWKVGGIPEPYCSEHGSDWLVGPIFSRSVVTHGVDAIAPMPVFAGGFAAIEPEFIVALGTDRSTDRIFIGAEIASSPVPAINDYGPTAVISDFGNNNGILIGPEVSHWRSRKETTEVSIWIDGELIGQRLLEDAFADALSARDFCIEHSQKQGYELRSGTLISSGAITGVHEARAGSTSKISFGNLGDLGLTLVPAQPAS